jgi:hypothetical protein
MVSHQALSVRLLTVLVVGIFLTRAAQAQMYTAYWSADGDTRFVRAAGDSTVLAVEVRHSPFHASIDLGLVFMYYGVRCASGTDRQFAFAVLGSGETEAAALKGGISPRFIPIRLADDEPESALVLASCLALSARRRMSLSR